jgi:hypothetical protein
VVTRGRWAGNRRIRLRERSSRGIERRPRNARAVLGADVEKPYSRIGPVGVLRFGMESRLSFIAPLSHLAGRPRAPRANI